MKRTKALTPVPWQRKTNKGPCQDPECDRQRAERVQCARCARARSKVKNPSKPPAGLRALIYARSGGRCECCGRPMALASMHLHHRKLRSQGGTWEPSNILGVLNACHNIHPRSIHQNPERSYALGHLVRRDADPSLVPWVYLDRDGITTPAPPLTENLA